MNILTNPTLTQTLSALEYPLADYQAFSVAWPHTAAEIDGLHRRIKACQLNSDEIELINKSFKTMALAFSTIAERAAKAMTALSTGVKVPKEEDALQQCLKSVNGYQLEAAGAGGVEPLRRGKCLPVPALQIESLPAMAREIFCNYPTKTQKEIDDVIEWFASSIRVQMSDAKPAAEQKP